MEAEKTLLHINEELCAKPDPCTGNTMHSQFQVKAHVTKSLAIVPSDEHSVHIKFIKIFSVDSRNNAKLNCVRSRDVTRGYIVFTGR